MSYTVIDICNMALSHINKDRISALTDNNKRAEECELLYPIERDTLIYAHEWSFARTRVALALLPDTYGDWAYAYRVPSDCLRFLRIYNGAGLDADPIEFEESGEDGNIILTDEEDAIGVYSARVTDTSKFDVGFVKTLSWTLAAELAQPLRADSALEERAQRKAAAALFAATGLDSKKKFQKPVTKSRFVSARA